MNMNYKSNDEKNGYGSNKATKIESFGVNLAASTDSFEIVDENVGSKLLPTSEGNRFGSNLAASSDLDLQIGHLEGIVPEYPTDLDIDDVDIDLDDDIKDIVPEIVPSFDFFGKDLLPDDTTKPSDDALIDFSKIKTESKSENANKFDDIKNIFDQIDQLSSDDEDEEEEKFEVHDLSKSAHLEGICQSFEEI
jgi:hypothetical protein